MVRVTALALLAGTLTESTLAQYSLTMDYSGPAFFRNFNFFTGPDPTNGHVQFVDENTANFTSLAGFTGSGNSDAIYLGVDSTHVAPQGRSAVRVSSNQTYNHALFIVDIEHMPEGCGTWPAFWLLGTSSPWPAAGEVDILEGVNEQTSNKMTLHTDAGVVLSNLSSSMTGTMVTSNCDVNAARQSANEGCQIGDQPSVPSFGTGFNAKGGGVFATEYTSQAIKIWFFPRGSIPVDITVGAPEPSNGLWGLPNALFAGNIDFDAHFCELEMIFDTTFCGDWAGNVWSQSECATMADTCEDYVTNNPAAFADAYWAINTLQVFQDPAMGLGSKLKNRRGGAVLPS